MYILRLFDRTDPQPIDAHLVGDGVTVVGRDPEAGWVIADPDCEISRHHLEICCRGGALSLRPLGANGVFKDGIRLADGEEAALGPGDAVDFGKYRLAIDVAPLAATADAAPDRTIIFSAPFGEARPIATDWADAAPPPPAGGEDSLLEAFCDGARLDVSALSSEEPAEIMRRAGAMYRQTVLGLGELVSERSIAKVDLEMDRTTIGAQDNNPFKWAPSRRLAIDLLLGREAGFLVGAEAIRCSFEDIRAHMLGTVAGFGAAVGAVFDLLSPAAIKQRLNGNGSFLKSREALAWSEYESAHAGLREQGLGGQSAPVNAAFAAAYRGKLSALGAGHSSAVAPPDCPQAAPAAPAQASR